MVITQDARSTLVDLTPQDAEGLCDECLLDAIRAYVHDRNVLAIIVTSRVLADDIPGARRVAAETGRIRASHEILLSELGIRRSSQQSVFRFAEMLEREASETGDQQ